MTFTLGGIAATILGLVLLLGAVAAAVVYVRASAAREATSLWKAEAEAQKARADRLEADFLSLTRRVERLEHENARLGELASGAAAVTALREHLDRQHAETLALLMTGRA